MPDRQPQQGPYYHVWLKPHWVLRAAPTHPFHGPYVSHAELWARTVDEISRHYSLNDLQEQELLDLTAAMPRGRVEPLGSRFVCLHGNETPKRLDPDTEKGKILAAFGLEGLEFEYSMDRQCSDSDKKAIRKLIGNIPY